MSYPSDEEVLECIDALVAILETPEARDHVHDSELIDNPERAAKLCPWCRADAAVRRQNDAFKTKHPEVPWNQLDPGIVDLVVLLVKAGLKTTSSCQGGDGHPFDFPTVVLETSIQNMEIARELVRGTLHKAGYTGFQIEEVRAYQEGPVPWPQGSCIRVVIWGPHGTQEV